RGTHRLAGHFMQTQKRSWSSLRAARRPSSKAVSHSLVSIRSDSASARPSCCAAAAAACDLCRSPMRRLHVVDYILTGGLGQRTWPDGRAERDFRPAARSASRPDSGPPGGADDVAVLADRLLGGAAWRDAEAAVQRHAEVWQELRCGRLA